MAADAKSPSTLGIGGGTGLSPGGANAGSGYSETRVTVGGLGYSRAFNEHFLLDANFGYGRNYLTWYEGDFAANLGPSLGIPGTNSDRNGSYGADPNQQGLPSFAVTGFETFGNPDPYTPELKHADQTFTYNANLTYAKGHHTIRIGTQLLNNRLNEYQPQRGFGPRGGFTFTGGVSALKGGASSNFANAFAQFLLGLPDSMGKSYQYLNPMTGIEWQSGVYAQDQWQVSHQLTLSYGLRWEYYPIMLRANQGMQRYDLDTNQVILGGVNGQPNGAGSTASKLQFAPRFGFAYRMNEKTVLRGGFGISIDPYPFTRAMRDPYPITIAQTVNATNSYAAAGSFTTGIPGYDTVAPAISNGTAVLPLSAYTKTLQSGTFRRGYLESYNLTFERALPQSFTFAGSYVGSHTVRQTVYFEANAGQTPGLGSAGQPLYTKFGRAAQTQVILPYGTTHYDALQLSLKRPLVQGVLASVAYTYSKSLDQATDDDSVPSFNAAAYLYRNYAVSDFDRRHNLEAAVVADLPFGAGKAFLNRGGPLSAIVGGWRINAIVSSFTGLPFTPIASATSLNAPFNTQVANQVKSQVQTLHGIGKFSPYFDTSAFAPVTTATFGNAGRNSLRGPGHSELDLGISRLFSIADKVHLEIRGEGFNVTNTPFFALPGNNVSNSSFGLITSTFGSSSDNRVLRFTGKVAF
jgi:hypothetical protein